MNSQEIGAVINMINNGDTCEFNRFVYKQALPACGEIRLIEKNRVEWWQHYVQVWPLKPATKKKLMVKGTAEMIAAYSKANKGKKLPFDSEKTLLWRDDIKLVEAYLSATSFSTKAITWAADHCGKDIVNTIIAHSRK